MSGLGGVNIKNKTTHLYYILLVAVIFFITWPAAARAAGASLKISPSSGVYETGGLVDVSFVVDTGGQAVNAIQADVIFPPDKLQVVNPVASTSFISLWVTAPTYSNTDGTIHFQGGLPNPGIKTSGGIISTVTFRIKSAGPAQIKFAATSRVLLNDGVGTNVLTSTGTADYTLKNPPPAGPVVTSPTHPDSNLWFNNTQVQFQWDPIDGAEGYSFIFDQSAKTVPDDAIDGTATAAGFKATADGIWYFHVRAKTTSWGGVTDFPVQIDATPPAAFTPKFDQNTVTIDDVATLRFLTTDAASGIDHYELKQVAIDNPNSQINTLFVEAASPYSVPKLTAGKYDFIVRAFDRAGNSTDGTARLTVIASGLPFYARVPLLQNPAVANGALIFLGVMVVAGSAGLVLRRIRIRSTFQHDLATLERDAQKKAVALQRELDELRRAQQIVNQDLSATTAPPTPPLSQNLPRP